MRSNKSALLIIFLTVFIDLVGFGIIIPLSPYLAKQYGATPFQVGLLMAIYSLMQFIFSPFWGGLSDRIGRRPVILVSLLGTGVAHLIFAYSTSIEMLFISRAFAGIAGGNLSTAMAYVADVTGTKDRSKGMGMVGAAFGLGFILGPFLGGILGEVGMKISSEPPFGMGFPALGAAALCGINFLFALKSLHETLPPEKRKKSANEGSRFERMTKYFRRPVIGPMLAVSFLGIFAFAQMEAVLFLLVNDRFGWGMSTAAFAFAYVGVVSAFTQGYLVRKLLPKWGERLLLVWGLGLSALGLALLGFATDIYTMAAIITVMSVGVGLRNPSIMGIISVKASEDEQGAVMGASQSLASLGRILGPPLGGLIYARWMAGPFVVAGVLTFACLYFVWKIYGEIQDHSKVSGPVTIKPRPTDPFKTNPLSSWGGADPSQNAVTRIGEYQLQNLLKQRIQFLCVDLRTPGAKPEFPRSVRSTIGSIVEDVTAQVPDRNFPVVVICETGKESQSAAEKLVQNSFLNVVVLEGGTRSMV